MEETKFCFVFSMEETKIIWWSHGVVDFASVAVVDAVVVVAAVVAVVTAMVGGVM